MPKRASNLLTMSLLTVMATTSLAGHGTSSMLAVHERPAACHQHGTAPVPQPVSYRCCQNGHDSAVLQVSFTSQPDSADMTSPVELSEALVPEATHQNLRYLATSSADPPNAAPLRI
jgi:hypothetical protein